MDVDVNIKVEQMLVQEQKIVLETLAKSVAKSGCKFLEIGSWCGDSTVILGKVAQKYGGHLYCVDWWKGNIGTDLVEIASKKDIFTFFWNRICSEGLEDVIVPIRARSDIAAEILKENTFDFIFIDGDHRYEAALQDIKLYAPLVNKNGGILCGHDCEGRISDYDMDFLKSRKDIDCYESVHCGVVLAVGSKFKDYSIHYSIWSVRAAGQGGWEPTNLVYPGIADKRQVLPPPIGFTRNYKLIRYGKLIYAGPRSLDEFDITEEKGYNRFEVIVAETKQDAERLIGEKISHEGVPFLIGTYKNHNIVQHGNCIYAFSQDIGSLDLVRIRSEEIENYQKSGKCFIGSSSKEVKELVDQNSTFMARVIKILKHFKT